MAEDYIDNFHRREIISTREVALDDVQSFKTLFAISQITEELEAQPHRITSHETIIGKISLHSDWLPHDAQASFRGMDFGRLDIAINGRKAPHQTIELSCFSRRPNEPNRIITLSEDDDLVFLKVSDSHATRSQIRGTELSPNVKREDIALWMARQALRDENDAFKFIKRQPANLALNAAANLLLMRAESKVLAVSTGQQFLLNGNRATVQTHTVKTYTIDDTFNYPQHNIESLWLIEPHGSTNKAVKDMSLVRRTLIEFSPTNTLLPDSPHDDTESFRIELSGKAGTDPSLLDAESARLADKYGARLLRNIQLARSAVFKSN